MPGQEIQTATIEVDAKAAAHAEPGAASITDVSGSLMILTWITFILLTMVLYKLAWKPILKALDAREASIRKALEEAEKARTEAAVIESKRSELIRDAETQAEAVIQEARSAAESVKQKLEASAREEARMLVGEARKEIRAATDEARDVLRKESVDLAVSLAGKCLRKEMNAETNRRLVRELTEEL